jgi:outer membrane immunogenic protein
MPKGLDPMKKLLLSAMTFTALAVAPALAADLPRRAPAPAYVPPAPPPISWTGCYIGANIGAIFGRGNATFNGFEVSRDNTGFAGGGQIGCDYQFAGGWVIGIRNMFDGTSLSRSRTFVDQFGNTGTVDFHNRWFDTLTGRIGYAVYPSWLLYGQGGVAWAKNSADVTLNGFEFGSFDRTRTGWTAGIGTEWMFARGWSVFLEGNWMDFGKNDHTVFGGACPVGGCFFNTHAQAGTALVGVNYRFGWGKAPYY